jgi:hypothetical protein
MRNAGLQTNRPDVKLVLRCVQKSCILGSVAVTYADVLARNMRAARAALRLDQEPLATRMRALGFVSWRRQTVAVAEKGERRLTAEELLGLAFALETSMGALLDPSPDDRQVQLPGGGTVSRGSVMRSVRHFNDGAVTWRNDDRPDFGSGTWPWPADQAGPELVSDLALGPFLDRLPPATREKIAAILRESPVIGSGEERGGER